MIKIYLISVLIYAVSIWLVLLDRLDQEYRESEEFQERFNTFTELRRDWFAMLILIVVGFCPIVHWFVIIINFWLVISPDTADAAIREAIDKILN